MNNFSSHVHLISLKWLLRYCYLVLLVVFIYHISLAKVYGAELTTRYLQVSSNVTGATNVTYKVGFNVVTSSLFGSVLIQFCSNDPFPQDVCDSPPGINVSNTSLVSQSGQTGFSILNPTSSNQIILSRTPVSANSGPVSFVFNNISNPTVLGSYFVRIQTFSNQLATGSSIDYGGIAFNILNNLTINAEVPPFLLFCSAIKITNLNCADSSGNYINFGDFNSNNTASSSSQLLVGTNAKNGYTISVNGTGLISGNNVINNLTSSDVSRPGTSQFGINLVSNVSPQVGANPTGPGQGLPLNNYSKANFYTYNSGDNIASSSKPENYRQYTVSYIVNVSNTQAPGVYVSTINYICVANF